jgi:hypothetical protein
MGLADLQLLAGNPLVTISKKNCPREPSSESFDPDWAEKEKTAFICTKKEAAMQQGSIIQTGRKQGPNVWSFRWSEKNRNGRRVYRKRVTGTIQQYPDAQSARGAVGALLAQINADSSHNGACKTTATQICEHFEQKELRSGDCFRSFATVKTYRGYIRKWVKPRWGSFYLDEIKAVDVEGWLRRLPIARSSLAKIRNILSVCLIMRAATNCLIATLCGLFARAQSGGTLQMS